MRPQAKSRPRVCPLGGRNLEGMEESLPPANESKSAEEARRKGGV